jgi:hypothetical protein
MRLTVCLPALPLLFVPARMGRLALRHVRAIAGGALVAALTVAAPAGVDAQQAPSAAQASPPAAAAPAGAAAPAAAPKPEEILEAPNLPHGAGRAECMWHGRRVVGLLWREDVDAAMRHLQLYDRFGCPAEHLTLAFRCAVRQGNIDTRQQDSLMGRIATCWLSPSPAAATAQ